MGRDFFMLKHLKTSLFWSLSLLMVITMSCNTTKNPLEDILKSDSPKIKTIADRLEDHEVQVLYTQIDRDENGTPTFKEYSFQLNNHNYFYPASTAKLPVAILALQRIKELQAEGSNITKESPFEIFDT